MEYNNVQYTNKTTKKGHSPSSVVFSRSFYIMSSMMPYSFAASALIK